MKSITLTLVFLLTPLMATANPIITAGATAPLMASNNDTSAALTETLPPLATTGMAACDMSDISIRRLMNSTINRNNMGELAWQMEVVTNFGADFTTYTPGALRFVRQMAARMNVNGTNILTPHEAQVMCELGWQVLDKEIVAF